MEKSKKETLEIERLELEMQHKKEIHVIDVKAISQEIIRRNIEVCVAVLKAPIVEGLKEHREEAVKKAKEHLALLKA